MAEDIGESNIEQLSFGKVDFSYPALVMRAIEDCRVKRGAEMRAGFFNEKLDKNGNKVREWKEDTRKVFISSVQSLQNLLSPKLKKDKRFGETKTNVNKRIKKAFDNFSYEEMKDSGEGIIKTEFKYIPQINEEVIRINPQSNKAILIKGGWDDQVNFYYDALIPIYDKLFAEIINVVEREGYFKKKLLGG